MLSKSQINFIKSLEQKKQRKALKLFLAEGVKIVNEIILSKYKIDSIFATKEWLKNYIGNLLSKQIVKVVEITEEELSKISQLSTPNQVVAVVRTPENIEFIPERTIVALESIRDPGNLGTIIRICDWFGISQLLCSPDCVDIFNPKVIQSSMGSFLRVTYQTININDLKQLFPKHSIYGAVMDGQNLHQLIPESNSIILIGNESTGLSENAKKIIDYSITIPRFGKAESLNAAIATALIANHFKMKNQD